MELSVVTFDRKDSGSWEICSHSLKDIVRKHPFCQKPRTLRVNLADRRADQFVLNHMELKSHPRASKFQINNVRQWLINANHPIAQEEVAFVGEEGEDDLIPVTSKPKTPLRRFIDRFNLLRLAACFRERKVRYQINHMNPRC